MPSRRMKSASSASCSSATATSLPAGGWSALVFCQAASGSPPLTLRRDAPELVLRLLQLAGGDGQQAIGAEREAFIKVELLLEPLAPEAEGPLGARLEVGFEKLDVRGQRCRRFGRGIGEVAEQVQVAEVGESPWQVVLDEAERPAEAFEPDLDEDAGRILDVVARRLHQAWDLAQLRQDAPRAFRERGIVEERLASQAGGERVGKELRAALPGTDRLELEEPRPDARLEGRPLEPLDIGQPRGVDGGEPPGETAERTDLRVNRGTAEILEQVVVHVDAVEGRRRGVDLVEVRQVLVDEVR